VVVRVVWSSTHLRTPLSPAEVRTRLAEEWESLQTSLAEDVKVRARQRVDSLTRTLSRRADEDSRRVNGVFDQMEAMLRGALDGADVKQLSFDDLLEDELHQWDRDRSAWQSRLDDLPEERQRELDSVAARYSGVRDLVFPFAVALVVPEVNN